MSSLAVARLPRTGMDFTKKVTAETAPDQRDGYNESQTDVASSPLVDQPEGTHACPACPLVLATSRELTNHLRGHNSPRSTTEGSGEEDYSCGVCHKVLSSASSLDRHVLVHSGERPFKCKHCQMAFTTNGNMNRHLRTAHRTVSPTHSYTDSDGSSDFEKPRNCRLIQEEYNNNEIAKRTTPELISEEMRSRTPSEAVVCKRKRLDYADEADSQKKHKILLSNARTEIRGSYTESSQIVFGCTFCGRVDFATAHHLDAHLERNHHDVPTECYSCSVPCKTIQAFNLHRLVSHVQDLPAIFHGRNPRDSVVGFEDLTFVDFSSEKFTTIARAACEKSLHRPASGETPKFQCSKCLRAFPCRSALEAHETDCGMLPTVDHRMHDDQSVRDDFFAGLDLQNKAALAEAKEGKDLADISSILSLTSGPIMQSISRSDASTPDNCKIKQSFGSSGSSGTPSSEYHEEEAQDAFAAEFRKMKLKGEFPCRLCKAIFPNLRALKGHNRAHSNVAPGMPYPCNMCPYSSTDKATLIRHLRSHNGDRPYECSICNYAFTTKANCERHVRNRHGKLSREEIKTVLIYHPNEDSTNDSLEHTSPRSLMRDDVRKSLVYPNERDELTPQHLHYPGEIRLKDESKLRQPGLSSSHLFSSPPTMQPMDLLYRSEELNKAQQNMKHMDDDLESRSSEDSVSLVISETKADPHQRIQASPMDLKKSSANESARAQSAGGEDAPLDLTMDVLDLSKRANAANAAAATKEKKTRHMNGNVEDLNSNNKDFYNTANQMLLTQALLAKSSQVNAQSPTPIQAFYANATMLYQNLASYAGPAAMIQPYMFPAHLYQPNYGVKDPLQKELVRGLQTSGGSLVEPSAPAYGTAFPQARNPLSSSSVNDQNAALMSSKLMNKSASSRDKLENSASSNSVKMVIKNGVLMPKQKQRRYRTERPFTCEHCSARFTLRSNMERHIKQQHPEFWSQRPRGSHSTRGRPPANPPTLLQNLGQSASHASLNHQSYSSLLPKYNQSSSSDYNKPSISDHVKYAILAQQLKGGNKAEEVESEEELIIDEESANVEKEAKEAAAKEQPTERTLSLLRGKLEANIECKTTENIQTEVRSIEEVQKHIKQESKSHESNKNKDDADDSGHEESSYKPKEAAVKTEMQDENNENEDLASVSEILDNASQNYQQFQSQYMSDEEGLVASTSDCNQSGSDEKSDSANSDHSSTSYKKKKMTKKKKKKSAYSMAPNRVICPYCERPFPWTSSLRRHILTHTGQKPFQCMHCELLFTTKSNCDRHLLRKHKNELNQERRPQSISSPEPQEVPNNNSQFAMRNVPERPYKCNQCPSSTFSTLGNLKKHRSMKHCRDKSPMSDPQNSPMEEEESPQDCSQECPQENAQDCSEQNSPQEESHHYHQDSDKQQDQSGYESQSSGVSDNIDSATSAPIDVPQRSNASPSTANYDNHLSTSGYGNNPSSSNDGQQPSTSGYGNQPGSSSDGNNPGSSNNENSKSGKPSPRSSPGPGCEAGFKCYLCDSGFSERQDCLDHLRDNHGENYERLKIKGALNMEITEDPQLLNPPPSQPSDGEERRGRFPDYSNRKVICAFCMRRFWSAEDLRRHMRTHTGERPFSCDICCRRFTLKHSMLRHRKKHESVDSAMYVGTSGDEDNVSMSQLPTITPRSQHQPSTSAAASIQERASLPQVARVATGDAAPSGLMRFNPYDNMTSMTGAQSVDMSASGRNDTSENNDNDLISNLLGIGDSTIIDRMLGSSVDDAARILGVNEKPEGDSTEQ